MQKVRLFISVVIVSVMTSSAAYAAGFADVPPTHPYASAIDSMLRAGVVKGNPSGLFRPDDSVNRAELLTMLYRAIGKSPRAVSSCPFSDVQQDAWYALVVCDAVLRDTAYVSGYPDGTFRPERSVTRAEALSMILKVMTVAAPDVTMDDVNLYKLSDVPANSWFARLVVSAYRNEILPQQTISGMSFRPALPLTRGEAAALIASGLNARGRAKTGTSSSSSSSSVSSSVVSSSTSSRSSSASSQPVLAKTVSLPFVDQGVFSAKQSMSYHFSVSSPKVVATFRVAITGAATSDVTCRLYLLNESGFSDHYFLGVMDSASHTCLIKASLESGSYQLQIQPTVAGAMFAVSAEMSAGDNNDGFVDASELVPLQSKTAVLDPGDVYDVYSFTITKEGTYTVEVTPSNVTAIIYLPPAFDQFGFSGPKVNAPYSYTPGTYYLVLTHPVPIATKQSYTVIIR